MLRYPKECNMVGSVHAPPPLDPSRKPGTDWIGKVPTWIKGLVGGWLLGVLWHLTLAVLVLLHGKPEFLPDEQGKWDWHDEVWAYLKRIPILALIWAAIGMIFGVIVERCRKADKYTRRVIFGLVGGAFVAWICGMALPFALFVYLFHCKSSVAVGGGGGQEWIRISTIWDNLIQLPLIGLPWTFVGAFAGIFIGGIGERLGTLGAIAGMLVGAGLALGTSPPDGWLFLTVPLNSCFGIVCGLAAGLLLKLAFWVLCQRKGGRHTHAES
jgi:hypothetical protein